VGVDYREQYRLDQLEPFWPNEFLKMLVAILCTLAVIMLLVVMPVALDAAGVHGVMHAEEPANPQGATPIGIKPEWYFLASYQYLRIMPTELIGIGGKTLGVVTQGVIVAVAALLPFWYRRKAHDRPSWGYRITVTVFMLAAIALTVWGGWPEEHGEHGETLISPLAYLKHKPLMFVMLVLALVVFYALIAHERRTIRRLLGPDSTTQEDERP
jgi:quinol-cytochrome oxidoreductase complex cytochrome b subunit